MSITSNYSPIAFDLNVLGDAIANAITVSRDVAGNLLVNGGTVAVTGGSPTIANTDLIRVTGDDGGDTIALDELNGALPAAELAGGLGDDILTGGSAADTLLGDVGKDTLLGRGGADQLDGGENDDILAGGAGNDTLIGGLGDDRMIWNLGDDSDVMDGGDGTDTVEVNAGNGSETFTLSPNGVRVLFNRSTPAPFTLDIGTAEKFVLDMAGGDDSFTGGNGLSSLIGITVDGGAGKDTIQGGDGADVLLGGSEDDFIDGNRGNDTLFLGAGKDLAQWDPGDANDVIEGGTETDTLQFNGANISEHMVLSANGSRLLLTRDVANIVMDLNDVEGVVVNLLGGSDVFTVNDLSGTDATLVTLNLAGTLGGSFADGSADTVTINGSSAGDTIALSTGVGTISVTGLAAAVTVNQAEISDQLTVLGGAGNDLFLAVQTVANETFDGGSDIDTIDTTVFNGSYVINLVTGTTNFAGESFINFENVITGNGADSITGSAVANTINAGGGADTVDGGEGNDTLRGSRAADILTGGNGDDLLNGGQGTDRLTGGAGHDILNSGIDGQTDAYVFLAIGDTLVGSARDQIFNFVSGTDKINLRTIDANSSATGNQAFAFSTTGPAAHSVWVIDTGTHLLVRGDVSGDLIADFEFQVRDINLLVASDFLL